MGADAGGQELDFTSTPLDYALLERSLGAARTMDWFGVIAKTRRPCTTRVRTPSFR